MPSETEKRGGAHLDKVGVDGGLDIVQSVLARQAREARVTKEGLLLPHLPGLKSGTASSSSSGSIIINNRRGTTTTTTDTNRQQK